MEVARYASIRDISEASWERLTQCSALYSAHAWLRYVEEQQDSAFSYLCVIDGDSIIAALPCAVFTGEVPRYYDPSFLFHGAGLTVGPVLLGGTREGYATEVLVDSSLEPEIQRQAVRLLYERFLKEAHSFEGFAGLLYVTSESMKSLQPFLRPDDLVVLMDAHAVRPAKGGIPSLLRSVPGRARQFKKEMRKFASAGCTVEVARISQYIDELAPLSSASLQKYGHPFTAEDEAERFRLQATFVDDISRIVIARIDGRAVGFTQFFIHGSGLYARTLGLDHQVARQVALYFNLTYYYGAELADAEGLEFIDYGCDTLDAKVMRGCHLRPLWGVITSPQLSPESIADIRRDEGKKRAEFEAVDPHVLERDAFSRGRARLIPR